MGLIREKIKTHEELPNPKNGFALDIAIAILVLCVGIALVALSFILKYPKGLTSAVLVVSPLVYLLFRKRLSQDEALPPFRLPNRIRLLSHVIFVISLSLSIWLLWNNFYYRPPVYFILCLVATTSIILDTLGLDEAKSSHTFTTLFKIVALSLTIFAGIYYEFAGIYGVDPWLHNALTLEIVNLGNITGSQFVGSGYYYFPVFHVASAITQIITGLSVYTSIFIAIGIPVAICCLFVFLIGRDLVNTKTGLLAALIVPLASYTIERATAIIPMSLGFFFFSAIIYLAFRHGRKRTSTSLMTMLLSLPLILTHTVATLAMVLSLIAIFIGIKVYKQMSKPFVSYELVSLTSIAFFGVAMLARWMQAAPGVPSFFDWNLAKLFSTMEIAPQFVLATPQTATTASYSVWLLDQGGYLLLLAFAIIGTLIYLHHQNRNGSMTALVLTAAVLIILPYGFILFSLQNILPGRWFLFLYVPLSILAVSGLSHISSLIRAKIGKLGMIILIILAVIFMTITNSVANDYSPQVFNGARRIGYTRSELAAITTASAMRCGYPETDWYYGNIFHRVIGNHNYMNMVQGHNRVFIERNYYLRHPEWDERYMTKMKTTDGLRWSELELVVVSDYMKEHGIDKSPLIYNNKYVRIYAMGAVK